MTTIAVNLQEMSADTAVVNSGPLYYADKLFRIGVSIFGTAGDGYMDLAFIEWVKSSRRSPQSLQKQIPIEHRNDILCVELRPGGIYLWNGWGYGERIHGKFYAIGSGSMVAMEGLYRGDTPAEAVKAAMRWDENTGGPIQTERLKRKR